MLLVSPKYIDDRRASVIFRLTFGPITIMWKRRWMGDFLRTDFGFNWRRNQRLPSPVTSQRMGIIIFIQIPRNAVASPYARRRGFKHFLIITSFAVLEPPNTRRSVMRYLHCWRYK